MRHFSYTARTLLGLLIITALAIAPAHADTLRVPADYATIQAAIDAAVNGDIVEVADGQYSGPGNRDLDFGGRAITVRSASGDPDHCLIVLDSAGHRGFHFHSGEGADSVVQGLQVRGDGGFDDIGVGVLCAQSSPMFIDCAFYDLVSGQNGGAVHCSDSAPTFVRCSLDGVTHYGYNGGALYSDSSNVTFIDCLVGGRAGNHGGAVYCTDSTLRFTRCRIGGTCKYGRGGAIRSVNSDLLIIESRVWADALSGGSLDCSESHVVLVGSMIRGEAEFDGAGVFSHASTVTLLSCTLLRCYALNDGGALYCEEGSQVSLDGCLLISNGAAAGAAIYCDSQQQSNPSTVSVSNSILWNGTDQVSNNDGSTLTLTYCAVEGGHTGDGNFDADPMVQLSPYVYEPVHEFYYLLPGSPCIDAGSNAAVPADTFDIDQDGDIGEPLPLDQQGNPRFTDDPDTDDTGVGTPPIVDIGPWEYRDGVLNVPDNYATIQRALYASMDGEVVELGPGVYRRSGNVDLLVDRNVTIRSAGGDPTQCIIDCEGGGRGISVSYWGTPSDVVIEGITIRHGSALDGGGVYWATKGTIRNCVIESCEATRLGGGVYSGSNDVYLIETVLSNNQASGGGGLNAQGSFCMVDCVVSGNAAVGRGGGVRAVHPDSTITNTRVEGNTAGEHGGGVYCDDLGATIMNCDIAGNTAGQHGGGVYGNNWRAGALTLHGSTLWGNAAIGGGGVFCEAGPGVLQVANSIVWNNSPTGIEADAEDANIEYCNVEDGWAGVGNIDANPLFVDAENGDYRLGPGSACIDAGDNTAVPADEFDLDDDGDVSEPIPFDRDGNPRFIDDPDTADSGHGTSPIVDMGAYEFQGAPDCPGDLDGDDDTDMSDLGILLAAWELDDGGDLDGDGDTDISDLGILLADFGCGP
jgi:predicted outer membrane repeat protein